MTIIEDREKDGSHRILGNKNYTDISFKYDTEFSAIAFESFANTAPGWEPGPNYTNDAVTIVREYKERKVSTIVASFELALRGVGNNIAVCAIYVDNVLVKPVASLPNSGTGSARFQGKTIHYTNIFDIGEHTFELRCGVLLPVPPESFDFNWASIANTRLSVIDIVKI